MSGQSWLWILLLAILPAVAVDAGEIRIDPPGEGQFVRDLAQMLTENDERRIRERAAVLLEEEQVPLVVVTIESMSHYGPEDMPIATYAHLLFDELADAEALNVADWNLGVLLLVSRDDQRVWIELGPGWPRRQADVAERILDGQIVPRFREGRFSAGIAAGVRAIDAMARGERLPQPRRTLRYYLTVGALLGLVVFSIISLVRHGSTGWAWLFWGAVMAALGYVLWQVLSSSRGRGGGGTPGPHRHESNGGGNGAGNHGNRRKKDGSIDGFSGGGATGSW